MAFIELHDLNKTFSNDANLIVALADVTAQIEEGSFLGVMGPSGSGKSTFLSLLGGLSQPTSGRILVDDIDIYALSGEKLADFRREYLGFVFQSFNLIPYLTALENVMLPLAVKRVASREKKELAESVLERVGLSNRAGHLPGQLSGGEQERIAIARALVNAPPLILADEPTGSLDTRTSIEIMELFRSLNGEGQTIVMVTHNNENRPYFDRTITLRDGLIDCDTAMFPQPVACVG